MILFKIIKHKCSFRALIYKYRTCINVTNVKTLQYIILINSYNVKEINLIKYYNLSTFNAEEGIELKK